LPALALLLGALVAGCVGFARTSPTASAYGAIVWAVLGINAFFAATVLIMAAFVLVRGWTGQVDRQRRVSFDNVRIFWHYTVAQSVTGTALVYFFPGLLVS
jgi:heme/copper-type cytochrome/quinol oxidase subunit 3